MEPIACIDSVAVQLLLNKVEQLGVDDGIMFAFVVFILITARSAVKPPSRSSFKPKTVSTKSTAIAFRWRRRLMR